jgi:hypothetical protein
MGVDDEMRKWELTKYTDDEIIEEYRRRLVAYEIKNLNDLYARKEDLDVTDGRIYDTKEERYV